MRLALATAAVATCLVLGSCFSIGSGFGEFGPPVNDDVFDFIPVNAQVSAVVHNPDPLPRNFPVNFSYV